MESERDGRPSNVVISKQSLYLHALQTAEVRANYYSAHFRHLRPHDGWQDIDVTVSKLTGNQVAAEMGQRGVIIHNASAFQKYVRDAIDQHIATRKAAMRYEQMGWKDNDTAFLWGNRLYRGTSIETVAASDDIVTRTERYGLGPTPNGNLIQWRAAVDTLFGIGAEALGFGFLAGFGAPLMHFHRAEEGGCLISLVSQGSGKGKSTAIDAATSIWGPRRIALEMTKFDTRASQAILLASICHLPVVFDELQDKDPGYITDTAYLFSQGRDKQRATRDGDLRHVASEWRTIMVSTSNRSVVEAIKGMDSAIDAPAYRVLEFDVPEVVKILPKHEALKAAMRDNAGHAGHEYLQYITHPDIVAWLRVEVPAEAVRINQLLNLRPEHRFWARSLAAIAIASEIVSTLGLVTFTPSRIMQWAFERVKEVIVEDAVPKKGASTRAVAVLAEYINGHTNSILVMPGPYQAGVSEPATRTPTNQLYIRYEIKGRRIIIAAKPFRRWLAKRDINHRALYTELKIENLLLDQRHITLSAGSSLPSVQEMSLIVDGNNPAISGTLADVSSFGFEVKGSGPKPAALRLRL
jgi:hypothetical protein